MLVAVALCH